MNSGFNLFVNFNYFNFFKYDVTYGLVMTRTILRRYNIFNACK